MILFRRRTLRQQRMTGLPGWEPGLPIADAYCWPGRRSS